MTEKICMNCKYRMKPNGILPQRGWCGNKLSPFANGYIYKGDTCDEFESKRKPRKAKRKEKE